MENKKHITPSGEASFHIEEDGSVTVTIIPSVQSPAHISHNNNFKIRPGGKFLGIKYKELAENMCGAIAITTEGKRTTAKIIEKPKGWSHKI